MDKVRIYVVAGPNQGKTTIAHILRSALEEHSFKRVSLVDTKPSGEPKQPIEQRVKATQERPVVIEVVSVASSPSAANAVPSIVARNWLTVMKNARSQIATLGTQTDAVNQAHLKELDEAIEELQTLTR